VRITAQLIEAATGAHLWADRFDGSLEHVFELQDQVAISVVGVIEADRTRPLRGTSRPGRLWLRKPRWEAVEEESRYREVVTELLEAAGILGKAGDSHGDGEEAAEREQAEQD
jgi:hypothetical protein